MRRMIKAIEMLGALALGAVLASAAVADSAWGSAGAARGVEASGAAPVAPVVGSAVPGVRDDMPVQGLPAGMTLRPGQPVFLVDPPPGASGGPQLWVIDK